MKSAAEAQSHCPKALETARGSSWPAPAASSARSYDPSPHLPGGLRISAHPCRSSPCSPRLRGGHPRRASASGCGAACGWGHLEHTVRGGHEGAWEACGQGLTPPKHVRPPVSIVAGQKDGFTESRDSRGVLQQRMQRILAA